MTILFRNNKTSQTLHVVGADRVHYGVKYDKQTITTIKHIPDFTYIWRCIHYGIANVSEYAELQLGLPADEWEILGVANEDTMFAITQQYVHMSGNGITISDDLKEGGDTL